MAIMLPLLGGILIALLALDVLATVSHAQGQGGPLTRRLSRLLWSDRFFVPGRVQDGSAGPATAEQAHARLLAHMRHT